MSDNSVNKQTVSAYIITLNEEDNIARAIESVRWMDEVIVLDSGSTDATLEIAEKLGAKVKTSEFLGFAAQKNAAMELCGGDWVFNLDADEEVTPELREAIEKAVSGARFSDMPDVFKVVRKTWYMGRWIKHCGWYPEYRARLSKRGNARWKGEALHEKLHGSGTEGTLKGELLHRPYANIGEHIDTIRRYTELWAKREAGAGRSFSFIDLIFRPAVKFVTMYFLRAGFLDGGPGFVVSVMGAWYTFLKYARLYEVSRSSK